MISAFIFASLSANDKEMQARLKVEPILKKVVRAAGLSYPPKQIFFRAFKDTKIIEIWGANIAKTDLKLIKTYPVLAASGSLGPKRRFGDKQVPEGWYFIDRFNPFSSFHLSLGLNYPNAADRARSNASNLGGDIFIHGNQVSAGCMAMGDPAVEEIYTLARMASGKVRVLILPSRTKPTDKEHSALYDQIYAINRSINVTHQVPSVSIDGNGNYRLK